MLKRDKFIAVYPVCSGVYISILGNKAIRFQKTISFRWVDITTTKCRLRLNRADNADCISVQSYNHKLLLRGLQGMNYGIQFHNGGKIYAQRDDKDFTAACCRGNETVLDFNLTLRFSRRVTHAHGVVRCTHRWSYNRWLAHGGYPTPT